jgi:hypothetical protein
VATTDASATKLRGIAMTPDWSTNLAGVEGGYAGDLVKNAHEWRSEQT